MKFKHCTKIFIITLVLILSHIFSNPLLGENPPDIIDADFIMDMTDATTINITAEVTVTRFTIEAYETTYTGSEIANSVDDSEMGAIKLALRIKIREHIDLIFSNADIDPISKTPSYSNNKFYDSFQVKLNSDYFGINQTVNSYELINGAIDMGALVNYSFDFYTQKGWNNTFIIKLGDKLEFKRVFGGTVNSNDDIVWKANNWNGETPDKIGSLTLESSSPTSDLTKEDINIDFILDTKAGKSKFTENINLKSIDISKYNFLPDFITSLKFVPADGIRLFAKNEMLDLNQTFFKNTIEPIKNKSKSAIENSNYNKSLNLKFKWNKTTSFACIDCFDINNMDKEPPVIATFYDKNLKLNILEMTSKALYGLVNIGAVANISNDDINFGKHIKNIGYPYNITILLPKNIYLDDKNVYTWNDKTEFKGFMEAEEKPDYKKQEIVKNINIDFKSSDLNILGFFTGKPEMNYGVKIQEDNKINVSTLPKEFRLPDKVDIKYLNSDALRLCIQENVFSNNDVDNYISNKKTDYKNLITDIIQKIKIKGNIKRDVFDDSINLDVNISNMSSKEPIKTQFYANTNYPVDFSFSLLPPSVQIPDQSFNVKGVENQTVKYRIYFQKGIDIKAIDKLDKSKVLQSKDERYYVEIIFTPEEHNLSCTVNITLSPSALYLIGLFMPCIISFIIVVILLILIIIIRKKRKFRGPKIKHEPSYEEDTSYQNEDYYVPPPPGSK